MNFNSAYPTFCTDPGDMARYLYHDPQYSFDLTRSSSCSLLFPQPSGSYAYLGEESGPDSHLEAITDDIETRPGLNPLGDFFGQKKRFLAKSVEEILGLIYEREGLKYENQRKADYDACRLTGRLLEMGSWRTGLDPGLDKTRGQIERDLLAVEREKRFEDVACWRDVTRLKTELRDALGEFEREKGKADLLAGYEV